MAVHVSASALARLARSDDVRDYVTDAVERVADNVGEYSVEGEPGDIELPVKHGVFDETDGLHGYVSLAHPSGLAVQAKHGALTRAAAAAGLEVKGD